MRITVRLGEPFWRSAGQRELNLNLEPQARVRDLLARLYQQFPAMQAEMADLPASIFVGEEQAGSDTILEDGSRVFLLWAVAGG